MKIIIDGDTKEIAALVRALQERRESVSINDYIKAASVDGISDEPFIHEFRTDQTSA